MSELLARITSHPDLCGGRPTIRGMRLRVADILDMLAHGATRDEILADFPDLEAEDLDAALLYAARAVDHPVTRAA
jgi:uncharacterized protein (DUF433 family)